MVQQTRLDHHMFNW